MEHQVYPAIIHRHVDEDPINLSLEIGTPGKGGALTIKCNGDDVEKALRRIDTAFSLRQYAQDLMDGRRDITKIEVLAAGVTVKLEKANGEKAQIGTPRGDGQ